MVYREGYDIVIMCNGVFFIYIFATIFFVYVFSSDHPSPEFFVHFSSTPSRVIIAPFPLSISSINYSANQIDLFESSKKSLRQDLVLIHLSLQSPSLKVLIVHKFHLRDLHNQVLGLLDCFLFDFISKRFKHYYFNLLD